MKQRLLLNLMIMAIVVLGVGSMQANFIQCIDGVACDGTANGDFMNGTENFNLINGAVGDDFISAGDGRGYWLG